ncbi:MAG: hypothetical protein HY586_00295 [Candidatus Omnitrophica bacterium]|nr:hypothetical protein [Candidatus Omnitrophota bacterium]
MEKDQPSLMPSFKSLRRNRIIACLALALFSLSLFPVSAQAQVPVSLAPSSISLEPIVKAIPARFGSVDSQHAGSTAFPIIYIQDAHNSLEAQRHIAALIHRLTQQFGIRRVLIEGYDGLVPLDELYPIQDAKLRKKVAYHFMDRLRLSGAQYAYLTREADFDLVGIDNFDAYLANLDAYAQAAHGRDTIHADWERMESELRVLAGRHFPKAIRRWQKLKDRFEAGQLSLADYLMRMNRVFPVTEKYPNLSVILSPTQSDEESGSHTVNVASAPQNIKGTAGKILRSAQNDKIDSKSFFRELDRYESDFAASQLTTASARQTLRYQEDLKLIRRLSLMQITPEEWSYLKTRVRKFRTRDLARFLARELKKPIVLKAEWERLIRSAENFYTAARRRDRYFHKHLAEIQEPTILVTGGFHKKAITGFLKKKNISYVSLMPKIRAEDPKHQKRYDYLMSGNFYQDELPFVTSLAPRPRAAEGEGRLAEGERGEGELNPIQAALQPTHPALARTGRLNVHSAISAYARMLAPSFAALPRARASRASSLGAKRSARKVVVTRDGGLTTLTITENRRKTEVSARTGHEFATKLRDAFSSQLIGEVDFFPGAQMLLIQSGSRTDGADWHNIDALKNMLKRVFGASSLGVPVVTGEPIVLTHVQDGQPVSLTIYPELGNHDQFTFYVESNGKKESAGTFQRSAGRSWNLQINNLDKLFGRDGFNATVLQWFLQKAIRLTANIRNPLTLRLVSDPAILDAARSLFEDGSIEVFSPALSSQGPVVAPMNVWIRLDHFNQASLSQTSIDVSGRPRAEFAVVTREEPMDQFMPEERTAQAKAGERDAETRRTLAARGSSLGQRVEVTRDNGQTTLKLDGQVRVSERTPEAFARQLETVFPQSDDLAPRYSARFIGTLPTNKFANMLAIKVIGTPAGSETEHFANWDDLEAIQAIVTKALGRSLGDVLFVRNKRIDLGIPGSSQKVGIYIHEARQPFLGVKVAVGDRWIDMGKFYIKKDGALFLTLNRWLDEELPAPGATLVVLEWFLEKAIRLTGKREKPLVLTRINNVNVVQTVEALFERGSVHRQPTTHAAFFESAAATDDSVDIHGRPPAAMLAKIQNDQPENKLTAPERAAQGTRSRGLSLGEVRVTRRPEGSMELTTLLVRGKAVIEALGGEQFAMRLREDLQLEGAEFIPANKALASAQLKINSVDIPWSDLEGIAGAIEQALRARGHNVPLRTTTTRHYNWLLHDLAERTTDLPILGITKPAQKLLLALVGDPQAVPGGLTQNQAIAWLQMMRQEGPFVLIPNYERASAQMLLTTALFSPPSTETSPALPAAAGSLGEEKSAIDLDGVRILVPQNVIANQSIEGNRAVLTNPNGYRLHLAVMRHRGETYLQVGNSVYLVMQPTVGDPLTADIETLNPIGNMEWFHFFYLSARNLPVNQYRFALPVDEVSEGESLRLFPLNTSVYPDRRNNLYPALVPERTEEEVRALRREVEAAAREIYEKTQSVEQIKFNFFKVIHQLAFVGMHGDAQNHEDVQDVLNGMIRSDAFAEHRAMLVQLSDHIKFGYEGIDWNKWKAAKAKLRAAAKDTSAKAPPARALTAFERPVEAVRLNVPDLENWEVVKVEALAEGDPEVKSMTSDRKSIVYTLGNLLIQNSIIVALAFAGGSATTVKKIMKKHKLIHLALKVATNVNPGAWISILQARIGLILGQNRKSKIVVVTNVSGGIERESDHSTRADLKEKYAKELANGQIHLAIQRSGLVLDPKTGEPIRYKDGRVATVAENHLWAFLALLLDKTKVIDILENTSGIIVAGNGDNVLNYPRPGMIGEMIYAREHEGRAVATVAMMAPSAGDKKGGFAARVTYRNRKTMAETTRIEIREVSEFPTRDKSETKFSATDLAKEKGSAFYQQAEQNGWFIEDIFGITAGRPKKVAFNVAFYAIDLKLIAARIFQLNEVDQDLAVKLAQIPDQEWQDRIIDLAEKVPQTVQPQKEAPSEDGSEAPKGWMTEQAIQDLIVNGLALLTTPEGRPEPETLISIAPRADTFLPYKGTLQEILDELGQVIPGAEQAYDLIANMRRYKGVVAELLKLGHRLVLGNSEYVTEVQPVASKAEVMAANQAADANQRVERKPFTPRAHASSLGVSSVILSPTQSGEESGWRRPDSSSASRPQNDKRTGAASLGVVDVVWDTEQGIRAIVYVDNQCVANAPNGLELAQQLGENLSLNVSFEPVSEAAFHGVLTIDGERVSAASETAIAASLERALVRHGTGDSLGKQAVEADVEQKPYAARAGSLGSNPSTAVVDVWFDSGRFLFAIDNQIQFSWRDGDELAGNLRGWAQYNYALRTALVAEVVGYGVIGYLMADEYIAQSVGRAVKVRWAGDGGRLQERSVLWRDPQAVKGLLKEIIHSLEEQGLSKHQSSAASLGLSSVILSPTQSGEESGWRRLDSSSASRSQNDRKGANAASLGQNEQITRLAALARDQNLIGESTQDNLAQWADESYNVVIDGRLAHEQIEEWLKKALKSADFPGISDEDAKAAAKELNDRFFTKIDVGTAGLRGKLGVGSARINVVTVGTFVEAHARYLEKLNQEVQAKPVWHGPKPENAVYLAYDSREGSYDPATGGPGFLVKMAAGIYVSHGIEVRVFDHPTPTPELAFAVHRFNVLGGAVFTASHNPLSDNGFKPYGSHGGQMVGEAASELKSYVTAIKSFAEVPQLDYDQALQDEKIKIMGEAIDAAYVDMVLAARAQTPDFRGLRVAATALHGTSDRLMSRVLRAMGLPEVNLFWVEDQRKPDGTFGKGGKGAVEKPNPQDSTALKRLMEVMAENNCDIGLANDPDADRLTVIIKNPASNPGDSIEKRYQILNGNQQMALILDYKMRNNEKKPGSERYENAIFWTTVVSSGLATAVAEDYDLKVIEHLVGFKYAGQLMAELQEGAVSRLMAATGLFEQSQLIKDQISKEGYASLTLDQQRLILQKHSHLFVSGGEQSYGGAEDSSVRDKDGIALGARFVEMAAVAKDKGRSLHTSLEYLYNRHGYFRESLDEVRVEGEAGNRIKKGIMDIVMAGETLPRKIAGWDVVAVLDYEQQKAYDPNTERIFFDHTAKGHVKLPDSEVKVPAFIDELGKPLPKERFVTYVLKSGAYTAFVTVRPSGTELKINLYVRTQGTVRQRAAVSRWNGRAMAEMKAALLVLEKAFVDAMQAASLGNASGKMLVQQVKARALKAFGSLADRPAPIVFTAEEFAGFSPDLQQLIQILFAEKKIKVLITETEGRTVPAIFCAPSLVRQVQTLPGILTRSDAAALRGFLGRTRVVYLTQALKNTRFPERLLAGESRRFIFAKLAPGQSSLLAAALLHAVNDSSPIQVDNDGFWAPNAADTLVAETVQGYLRDLVFAYQA